MTHPIRRRLHGKRAIAATLVGAMALATAFGGAARAETDTVRLAEGFGLAYLPITVMTSEGLIEKHAAEMGLGEVTVELKRFSGGPAMIDALLSGNVDFISGGLPPLLRIWTRTRGKVKAMAGLVNMPLYLNTVEPDVQGLADFDCSSKIALPAVKVSIQAVILQMAAAKEFGMENYEKLDPCTVSMKHPDAMAALLGGQSEVKSHFASMPFLAQELKEPKVHTVTTSYEVLGGEANGAVIYLSGDWKEANPKTYNAVWAAFQEAIELINTDKTRAAAIFVEAQGSSMSVEDVAALLEDESTIRFDATPQKIMPLVNFLADTGRMDPAPEDWTELFFENVHHLPGD